MAGRKGATWRSTPARHAEYRAEIVRTIQQLAEKHGYPPACREVSRQLRGRIQVTFGTWNKAIEAAGFEPRKPGQSKPPPLKLGAPDHLPLTSREGIVGWVRIDPLDRATLVGRHWNLGTDGYAYGREGGRQTAMHRLILGLRPGDGQDADHINGDRLDNRQSNLRVVTRAENLQNRTVPATGRSRFRGVGWSRHHGRWLAAASVKNQRVHIGLFDDELEAARAAQAWRDEHMPFAQPDPALTEALA